MILQGRIRNQVLFGASHRAENIRNAAGNRDKLFFADEQNFSVRILPPGCNGGRQTGRASPDDHHIIGLHSHLHHI